MKEQSVPTMTRSKIFGRPGIPIGLVIVVMIVIVTQAAALLMNQPAAYWLHPRYAMDAPFGFLLNSGPILYLVVVILYVFIVGLLLSKLNVAMGLPLVAVLVFIHTFGLSEAAVCGFFPLYQVHSSRGCDLYPYVLFTLPTILFCLFLLGARLPERFSHWGKRLLVPLAILWTLVMAYGVFHAAFPPDSPWKPLAPAHSPGPRTMAAVAYDSKRQRAVLFGGMTRWHNGAWLYDNSTWEWDGKDWIEMDTPVAPAGRIFHAMAYDERREKVFLYGGQNASDNLADLWEWDGVTWHRLCPVCNPAARFGHKMIFNAEHQEIMIYGGQDGEKNFAEGWTWNGATWNYLIFDDTAPAMTYDPLIYESTNQRAVSFIAGGWGGTWILEGSNWYKLDLTVQPPIRTEATFVYDPLRNYSVLFAGTEGNEFLFDDTWMFDGGTWSRVDTPSAPPPRNRCVAFYDPVRKSIILYGGARYGFTYSDTWELKLPEGDQR